MATYIADAYNANVPISTTMAGYMFVELQAIKNRMNVQIGSTPPVAGAVTVSNHLSTIDTSITNIKKDIVDLGKVTTAERTRKITISNAVPSGAAVEGDIWMKY